MRKYQSFYIIEVILLITAILLFFISCKQDTSTLRAYQPPENINDGLDVGTLEEVNIDPALIERGIYDINRGKYGEVHSILIYKDGRLVVGRSKLVAELLLGVMLLTACAFSPEQAIIQKESYQHSTNLPANQLTDLPVYQSTTLPTFQPSNAHY